MNEDHDLSTEPLIRIVCAAIRHEGTGLVIAGTRHYDSIMRDIINTGYYSERLMWFAAEQGFLTNKQEFVTREQAWKIAEAAGQIRPHPSVVPGTLHSEDLY